MSKLGIDWRGRFVDYLTSERRYSEHTISAYESDLNQFSATLAKGLLAASTDEIRRFVLGCLDAGVSPKTARRKLSTFKSFYGFVFAERGLNRDPSKLIRAPRAFDAIIRPITLAEIDQLLATLVGDRPLIVRDRALVYIAYGSGLRVSEIVNMRTIDVNSHRCLAKVRRGKGQKDRFVPLSPPAIGAIRSYLETARPRFAKEPDNELLFIGRNGGKLTRQRVWQVFTGLSIPLLGRPISPHKYRHAFVTDTINGGASSRVVQKMVGHVSVNTTMDYMHSDIERTRAEYLKSHPRGVAL
jgi:site-specific recombinase XerD